MKEKLRKFKSNENIDDYENVIPIYDNEIYSEERNDISCLKDKIEELKEIDGKIVKLFYYGVKSIKDIAKELDLTENNVKQRLHRIRKKVRKEIAKESKR